MRLRIVSIAPKVTIRQSLPLHSLFFVGSANNSGLFSKADNLSFGKERVAGHSDWAKHFPSFIG